MCTTRPDLNVEALTQGQDRIEDAVETRDRTGPRWETPLPTLRTTHAVCCAAPASSIVQQALCPKQVDLLSESCLCSVR